MNETACVCVCEWDSLWERERGDWTDRETVCL